MAARAAHAPSLPGRHRGLRHQRALLGLRVPNPGAPRPPSADGGAPLSSALVIGSQGALGSTVVAAFDSAGWDVQRAARRPGTSFRLVDLDTPSTLRGAFEGIDVAVNTVPHPGLAAERAVLAGGGVVLNISALPAAHARALRAEPIEHRGTVVMNAGLVPGVTSLVAADLVARHPESDTVELALTLSAAATSGPAAGDFVHRHLSSSRSHATAAIPFPRPIGERRAIEIAEEERGWLGAAGAGRAVRTYMCLAERPLHAAVLAANRTGLLKLLPRAPFVSGRKGVAGEPTREQFAEWVAVRNGGRRLAARTVQGEGDYRATAAATVVFAAALRDRPQLAAGCFDPEDLFTLAELAAPLEAAGIRVVEQSVAA